MGLTEIIVIVLSGLVVGALARLIIPGRQRMGILVTILVGIGGSFLGALIGNLIFGNPGGSFILAVAGAALIVFLLSRFGRV